MLTTALLCTVAALAAFLLLAALRATLRLELQRPGLALATGIAAFVATAAVIAYFTSVQTISYGDDEEALLAALKFPSAAAVWVGRLQTFAWLSLTALTIAVRLQQGAALRGVSLGVVVYWSLGVMLPAAVNGPFTYHLVYMLLGLLAFSLTTAESLPGLIRAYRDAILVLTVVSLVAFAISPRLVSDVHYEGVVFGPFPRLAGFTYQANVLGAVLAPWFLCVVAQPYRRRWLQGLAIALAAAALLASQSKTAIGGTLLGLLVMTWGRLRHSSSGKQALTPGRMQALLALVLFVTPFILGYLILKEPDGAASTASKVKSLGSATGRTEIWTPVLAAWEEAPLVGGGPALFSSGRFAAIPEVRGAPHAHNQIIDLLGRSGLVGLAGYLFLVGCLARAIAGLTGTWRAFALGLVTLVVLQSLFEVPLVPAGLSMSSWLVLLLIAVCATAEQQGPMVQDALRRPSIALN